MYLTTLNHIADQYPEVVHVALSPSSSPISAVSPTPSSSSLHELSHPYAQSYTRTGRPAITHVNFVRLQKSSEVIQQMLRHQSKPYLQSNPPQSGGATAHQVPASHLHSQSVSLGVENAATMGFIETMLSTGGLGLSPPPNVVQATGVGQVGAAENWYWQQSQDVQAVERETSDIRKGLEAAGF
jgi:son of sevenless